MSRGRPPLVAPDAVAGESEGEDKAEGDDATAPLLNHAHPDNKTGAKRAPTRNNRVEFATALSLLIDAPGSYSPKNALLAVMQVTTVRMTIPPHR